MKLTSALILSILLSTSSFTAIVVRVSGYDTIVVLTNDKMQIKIRLEGIDCPEYKQDFAIGTFLSYNTKLQFKFKIYIHLNAVTTN